MSRSIRAGRTTGILMITYKERDDRESVAHSRMNHCPWGWYRTPIGVRSAAEQSRPTADRCVAGCAHRAAAFHVARHQFSLATRRCAETRCTHDPAYVAHLSVSTHSPGSLLESDRARARSLLS